MIRRGRRAFVRSAALIGFFNRACIVRVRVSHLICFDELKCCLKCFILPLGFSRIRCRPFLRSNIPRISADSSLMIRLDDSKKGWMPSFKKKAADAQKRGGSEKCYDGGEQLHVRHTFIVIACRRAADVYPRPTPTARNVSRLPNSWGSKIRRPSITTGVAMD